MIDTAICRNECDLVLKNAQYVDVFSGCIKRGDIGVCANRIAGVGNYRGKEERDMSNLIICPGFIDAHVHIESSQLSVEEFAGLAVPRGTTCVIADPHEITNVCGVRGAQYIADAAKRVPLDVKVMLPSCVPATPFETSGATLGAGDIKENIGRGGFFGLGEFMNFPAVLSADKEALEKLESAQKYDKVCDGHAPGLSGEALNAYICGGISTDHECESAEEAAEKVSKGMYVHLRYGSSARNLLSVSAAVTSRNYGRFLLCTDDCHAVHLKERGHMDEVLRVAVKAGIDPIAAVTMATINAAQCYGLKGRGAIAPGFIADFVVVDNLRDFNVQCTYKGGKIVAKDNAPLFDCSAREVPAFVKNTVFLTRPLTPSDFRIPLKGGRARVIGIREGSIVTDAAVESVRTSGGFVVADGDISKLFVIERHKGTGNIGKALIKGYGFKGGALAVTVSHDSHNLIALGDDDECLALASNELAKTGGGMALAQKGGKVYSVPLDICGIMSSAPAAEHIEKSERIRALAYSMGVKEGLDAFLSLAFLSLAVIPHLKLLDTGLFDVDKFCFVPLEADG